MSPPQLPHPPTRNRTVTRRLPSAAAAAAKKSNQSKPSSPDMPASNDGERTVKKLRLSKALTIPEATKVSEACRRMAQRRVDAVLLTDSNGLLSGIITDKDIAMRVVAEGLRPEQTIASKIMTRNPIFVSSDTLTIDALHAMVQGKCRHLPVVENGEVVALLDITRCLYDAIARMEKIAEQGSAIAAAVEGVERHLGNNCSAQQVFIETLRGRMFKPTVSTIDTENTKTAVVSPSDPVCLATRKMRECRVSAVVVVAGGKPQGIFTSRDVLMRVVAHNLSPELTLVEKVMTASPECATLETTILDALHVMHDRKFLHIPVVDHDECLKACLDVLQITHAAVSMFDGGEEASNVDAATLMMQNFWDSGLPREPTEDECDTRSELSTIMTMGALEAGKFTCPPLEPGSTFAFKFKDQKGRVHRCYCAAGSESLAELLDSVRGKLGPEAVDDSTQLLYEDEDGDTVLLLTDGDLVGAVSHARSLGWKVLKLHVDNSGGKEAKAPASPPPASPPPQRAPSPSRPNSTAVEAPAGLTALQAGLLSGAVSLASMGVMVYLKRSRRMW